MRPTIRCSHWCATTRPNGALGLLVALCMLGLGLTASAQDTAPAANQKGVVLHKFVKPPQGPYPTTGVVRDSASAQDSAPALNPKEVVLHNFVSPPHGAYPATGVIRDHEGNLYGTTNGAYSDTGGGGTHNAGVVFKLDTSGNQTVLYSFTGGADGSSPNGLIRDLAGNLYGTTSGGGASGAGVVFKVNAAGQETVLHSFTGGGQMAVPPSQV